MQAVPEPVLTRDEWLTVAAAVKEFNDGQYFECHETLEAMWLRLRGPTRDFFQGLIQVSVGFHHLRKRNLTGARRTFARALARLEAYPASYLGFDLAAERERIRALLEALSDRGLTAPGAPPAWSFEGQERS